MAAPSRRMNVLMVVSDQHLATCIAAEGDRQVITPHMDRLAREGTLCRGAYTANPICTPSRVSIFSGQYCHNHGYYGLSGPRPEALPSFLSHFREAGYRTAGVGNLHVPNRPRNWLEHHLDHFADYHESIEGELYKTPYYDKLRALGLMEKEDMHFFHHNMGYFLEGFPSPLPFELSQEGWCTEEAIRFIDAQDDRPFCMQVALQRPHQPFTPDKRFWEMYPEDLAPPATLHQDPSGRPPHFKAMYEWFRKMKWPIAPHDFESAARRLWRGYLACITHVDHSLGLMLEHLDRRGLAENTIVIYTADHGGYSGTYGIGEKAPGICSEAVCRVPMIWRVPGVTRAGTVTPHLMGTIDMAPTLASLCGLKPMESVDGVDVSPILRGEAKPVHEVAVTEFAWSKAIRFGPWRLVHYQPEMFPGQEVGELYNLEADPLETRNLYHNPGSREVVERGRRLLLEWLIRTTRVKSIWPAPGDWRKFDYPLAGDGKESNAAGPALRARNGQTVYL